MWLYDSGRGYTQKCVVIQLVHLLLRRQPVTNTSRWLYVLIDSATFCNVMSYLLKNKNHVVCPVLY